MASFNSLFVTIPPAVTQRRVRTAATAAKSSAGKTEEKSLLDFILGSLTKQDQFYETDPILKKVENNTSGGTTTARRNTVIVPPKKNETGGGFGGLGGLFSKKD